MQSAFNMPVVLTMFNRADVAARVLDAIRDVKPERLFVIADGPRPQMERDAEKCAAARAVLERIDWPCEVERIFSDRNWGPRVCVANGLNRVFEQVSEAIILEHDCLPNLSFFRFCAELLAKYRDEPRVGMISGSNFLPRGTGARGGDSYYFSKLCPIWGWATWRRAWNRYDADMRDWPALRRSGWLQDLLHNAEFENYWRRQFDSCCDTRRDSLESWDLPWLFTFWKRGMLSIIPKINLVSNIGFGKEAVHTRRETAYANLKTEPIDFPLSHPREIVANQAADRLWQSEACVGISALQRVYWKLRLPIPIWMVRRLLRWFGR